MKIQNDVHVYVLVAMDKLGKVTTLDHYLGPYSLWYNCMVTAYF